MDTKLEGAYRAIRRERPNIDARTALYWARDQLEEQAVTRAIEWDYYGADAPTICGYLDDGAIELRVYPDDEVYDWGDIEPSEQDRENLEVIGVGVRIAGDDADLDSIWGVGYLHRDALKEAIATAVAYGFIDHARGELLERSRLAGYVETV